MLSLHIYSNINAYFLLFHDLKFKFKICSAVNTYSLVLKIVATQVQISLKYLK
jgi:hypothetical protein